MGRWTLPTTGQDAERCGRTQDGDGGQGGRCVVHCKPCALNRDFTFGSQPLAIAFTETESIGGRVWPNVIFSDQRFDYAFSVWGNSTFGPAVVLALQSPTIEQGMTIRQAESLAVLDLRALTDEQLLMAKLIFDKFRDKELKPAYLADADPNRILLDRRVVCDLLGFDEDVYEGVRRQWPSGALRHLRMAERRAQRLPNS